MKWKWEITSMSLNKGILYDGLLTLINYIKGSFGVDTWVEDLTLRRGWNRKVLIIKGRQRVS